MVRRLQRGGYTKLITRDLGELDLTQAAPTEAFFEAEKPDHVFLCAARVGGIYANNAYPAEFIHDNLAIQTNVIHQAWRTGVRRLLFLGSSCIYPRDCPQPIKEEYLLTGPLETTNRPYAVAKIAGIEMCWAYNRQYGSRFLAVMPTNLFGPGDNYHLESAHVLPALIRKMHTAREQGDDTVTVWGTGQVRRELLASDEMADAAVFLMELPEERFDPLVRSELHPPLVNIGCGKDLTVRELAELVADVVGFRGALQWDTAKRDGTPRKLLDVSRLAGLGWQSKGDLREGIAHAYKDFLRAAERSSHAAG
jgi:GDP-L-fucose synthase